MKTFIPRANNIPIIKEQIALDNLINYEDIDLELLNALLNETIEENVFSTIDLLKLLHDNYQGNMLDTIKNIKDYSKVHFNCYYAARQLKEKLNNYGYNSEYISYKSIGFSSKYGDDLIKEAHMSLLIPTIRNNKVYYIILDPGYRIPNCLGFYADDLVTNIQIDNDEIIIKKVKESDYSYMMQMTGYNRYSMDTTSYTCEEYFNPFYATLNPEEILFPICYEILNGYRIINYHEDKDKCAYIKLMIVDKYLECRDYYNYLKLSFEELSRLNKEKLKDLLKKYTDKLNQDIEELIMIIDFLLDHNDELVNEVINKKVLREFSK